jgi:hypothetical protein
MATVPTASTIAPASSGTIEADTSNTVTAAPVPNARTRVG